VDVTPSAEDKQPANTESEEKKRLAETEGEDRKKVAETEGEEDKRATEMPDAVQDIDEKTKKDVNARTGET